MLRLLDHGAPALSPPNFRPGRAEAKERKGRSGNSTYLTFFFSRLGCVTVLSCNEAGNCK